MLLDEKIDIGIEKHRSPDFIKFVRSAKYPATRYKISDEVTEEIAWLMMERPHLLLSNFQFAMGPKPEAPIYVEWDAQRAINLFKPDNIDYLLENDRYLGIIVKDNLIAALVSGHDRTKPYLHYVSYGVGENHRVPAGLTAITFRDAPNPQPDDWTHEEQKLAFLLGATYHPTTKLTNEFIDWINSNVTIYMEREFIKYLRTYANIAKRMNDCCGEFRFMMSMLLWINQQHVTYHDWIPASRGMRERGRPIAFAAHNVVKLQKHKNIRKAIIRSLITRAGPRRHEVRPTWRTINAKPGCIHEWPMFPNERGHFVCSSCEAKRFRVKNYMRGDATKGCVVKEYVA